MEHIICVVHASPRSLRYAQAGLPVALHVGSPFCRNPSSDLLFFDIILVDVRLEREGCSGRCWSLLDDGSTSFEAVADQAPVRHGRASRPIPRGGLAIPACFVVFFYVFLVTSHSVEKGESSFRPLPSPPFPVPGEWRSTKYEL